MASLTKDLTSVQADKVNELVNKYVTESGQEWAFKECGLWTKDNGETVVMPSYKGVLYCIGSGDINKMFENSKCGTTTKSFLPHIEKSCTYFINVVNNADVTKAVVYKNINGSFSNSEVVEEIVL